MKKIISLIVLLLLTGCTYEYNLEISNNSFKENIDVYINEDEMQIQPIYENGEEIEADDILTSFINGDVPSLLSEDKNYIKIVKRMDHITNVNLKYNYNEKNFATAYSINNCFENFKFDYANAYEILANGKFNCLYSDNFDIKIKSNNKVLYNNADQINNNVYIWHIDKNNVDNVDINIKIDKGISYSNLVMYILISLLLVGLSIFIYIFYRNRKNNNTL